MIKRNALNRGTAVHLGGARVRFVWACGCSQVEAMRRPDKRPEAESTVVLLVRHWRLNGVVLPQCRRHPDWHSPKSQLERLNAENPQSIFENK